VTEFQGHITTPTGWPLLSAETADLSNLTNGVTPLLSRVTAVNIQSPVVLSKISGFRKRYVLLPHPPAPLLVELAFDRSYPVPNRRTGSSASCRLTCTLVHLHTSGRERDREQDYRCKQELLHCFPCLSKDP